MKRKQPHVCGACVRSIKNRLVTLHAFKKDKMENYTRVSPYVFVCHSYLAVRTRMLLVCYKCVDLVMIKVIAPK